MKRNTLPSLSSTRTCFSFRQWPLFIALLFCLLTASVVQAQSGRFLVGGGIGTGDFYAGNAPFPIHAFFEKGLGEHGSGGVFLSYGTESEEESYYDAFYRQTYSYKYRLSSYRIAARYNYVFNEFLKIENDKLEVYGGAMLGFRYGRVKYEDNFSGYGSTVGTLGSIFGSGFFSGIHIGGRYKLTENLGGYVELGRAASWLKIGVFTSL